MPPAYRAILLDCFNTLFVARAAAVPRLQVGGRTEISTAPVLAPLVEGLRPGVDVHAIHAAMVAARSWAKAQRAGTEREITAYDKFRHMLALLDIPDAPEQDVLRLIDAHMAAVTGSFALPESHREAVQRLGRHFTLGIVSNFDHAPALLHLLERHGVAQWFDPVLVSGALGVRKPARAVFEQALGVLDVPRDAVLFVGDSVEEDVAGAQAANLDVVWLDANGQPPPAQPPTHVLRALPELPAWLGV